MPKFTDTALIPKEVLDRFKYEIADELGLMPKIQGVGWGEMTSRECGRVGGKIGGNMVKIMIKYAEQAMSANAPQ